MFRDVPVCSGMFRNVPECYMFQVLSTPKGFVPHLTKRPLFQFSQARLTNWRGWVGRGSWVVGCAWWIVGRGSCVVRRASCVVRDSSCLFEKTLARRIYRPRLPLHDPSHS